MKKTNKGIGNVLFAFLTIVSIFFSVAILPVGVLSVTEVANVKAAETIVTADQVIDTARRYIGSGAYDGWCLKFVQDVLEETGITAPRLPSAKIAGETWIISTDRSYIPKGACIFFTGSMPEYGHIEISCGIVNGKGNIIGTGSGIVQEREMNDYYRSTFVGWGWLGGIPIPSEPEPEPVLNPFDPVSIPDGIFTFENVATLKKMNYDWLSKIICVFEADDSVEQTFRILMDGLKCIIETMHPDGGFLNSDINENEIVVPGIKLNLWGTSEDDTTKFYLCRDDDKDVYYLASATDKNVVIAAYDNHNQLAYENYNGSENQQWRLIKVDTEQKLEAEPVPSEITSPVSHEFIKGIDVSSHQGGIDWESVKSDGIEFVNIRCGSTDIGKAEYGTDVRFEENYNGAKEAGLKTGIYFYTGAATKNDMKANIESVLKSLSGKHFDLPVYIDIEQCDAQLSLGKKELTDLLSYGCSLIRAAGYKPGVYANQNWFNNYIDKELLSREGINIWMAAWPYSEKAADPSEYDYSEYCQTWQYSDHGSVAGINENVDVNVMYDIAESVTLLGDADLNGTVDLTDLSIISLALADKKEISGQFKLNADVNGDGIVDLVDLATLRQFISKKIESL